MKIGNSQWVNLPSQKRGLVPAKAGDGFPLEFTPAKAGVGMTIARRV